MKRFLGVLALLMFLAACDDPSRPESPQATAPVVSGTQGGSVALLPQEQWLDKNVLFVLDGSGSMSDAECSGNRSKLEVAKAAVGSAALRSMEQANVGLIVFNGMFSNPRVVVMLSRDKTLLARAVNEVTSGGRTPLWGAISIAHKELTERMERQAGYGDYVIVVVTDGAATDMSYGELREEVVKLAERSPIRISVIGFCLGEHSLNIPGSTQYVQASDPESLKRGLEQALAETPVFDSRNWSR